MPVAGLDAHGALAGLGECLDDERGPGRLDRDADEVEVHVGRVGQIGLDGPGSIAVVEPGGYPDVTDRELCRVECQASDPAVGESTARAERLPQFRQAGLLATTQLEPSGGGILHP